MTTVKVFAPAKVNLTLHVTGRRDDGYHLLDSLVAFADVGDELSVSDADDLVLTVNGPEAGDVPRGSGNLVMKAALILAEDQGAALELTKNLPVSSGIGGGSSDAAATIRAMMALRGLGRSELERRAKAGDTDMQDRAKAIAALGADVPMCLFPRTLRARGTGDRIDPVDLPALSAVLVNPRVPVSTPDVFAALSRRENPPMPDVLPDFVDSVALIDWLAEQRNDLERAALRLEPSIATVLAAIRGTSACLLARMSGSGATCFGLYADAGAAAAGAARLKAERPEWWVVEATLGDQSAMAVPRLA
jgi:4-diphosphocytidyl-2-C-methyl-D-erythritol kinase